MTPVPLDGRWLLAVCLIVSMAAGLVIGGQNDTNDGGMRVSQKASREAHGDVFGVQDAVRSLIAHGEVSHGRREDKGEVDEPTPPLPEPAALPYVEAPAFDLCAYGWPCAEAERIVYGPTALCPTGESNGDASAISWAGAQGVFQLMPVHAWRFAQRGWDYWVDAFVAERNIAIAYELWLEQGWAPWDC